MKKLIASMKIKANRTTSQVIFFLLLIVILSITSNFALYNRGYIFGYNDKKIDCPKIESELLRKLIREDYKEGRKL